MFIWKLPTQNPHLASVRYRALLPIVALRRLGVTSRICARDDTPDFIGAKAILFVKAFSFHDLALAEEAYHNGLPVVLDLCDNIFTENYCTENGFEPATVFRKMAVYAALITTTGPALADVLRHEVGTNKAIEIIPDGIETDIDSILAVLIVQLQFLRGLFFSPARNLSLFIRQFRKKSGALTQRLRESKIRKTKPSPVDPISTDHRLLDVPASATTSSEYKKSQAKSLHRVLWFGNWGAANARFGMSDIMLISNALTNVASRFPIELVVISNNRRVFDHSIALFPFATRYVEWSSSAVRRWLGRCDVVILPNSGDPFSICKSANRALLALSHGVPVVATTTPALRELGGNAVLFDDWQTNLCYVLGNPKAARLRIDEFWPLIALRYSYQTIANCWYRLLASLPINRADSILHSLPEEKTIGVLVTILQDVDIAMDLVWQSKQNASVPMKILIVGSVLDSAPWLWKRITECGYDVWVISGSTRAVQTRFPQVLKALIVVAVSNLRAHRIAVQWARMAEAYNIPTYTLQHGLDNVGITYSDSRHPIEHVRFPVRRVFSWGGDSSWDRNVSRETREKLYPVGRIAPNPSICAVSKTNWPKGPVVGVFENLHWHRYSSRYRRCFIADLRDSARRHVDSMFLVCSHPSGAWLKHNIEVIQGLSNVFLLDEKCPQFSRLPLRVFVHLFDMVITTPSTVALDAAQAGVPVAVAHYDLELNRYAGLTPLRCADDWAQFHSWIYSARRHDLLKGGEDFVSRHVVAGDAAHRIFDIILRDCERSEQPAPSYKQSVTTPKESPGFGLYSRENAREEGL